MNELGFHIRLTSFMGTANHLIERHGFTEADVDRDDHHGLLVDHIRLHGGEVRHDGAVHFPRLKHVDVAAVHVEKVGA
jgi:hypothetical protein